MRPSKRYTPPRRDRLVLVQGVTFNGQPIGWVLHDDPDCPSLHEPVPTELGPEPNRRAGVPTGAEVPPTPSASGHDGAAKKRNDPGLHSRAVQLPSRRDQENNLDGPRR